MCIKHDISLRLKPVCKQFFNKAERNKQAVHGCHYSVYPRQRMLRTKFQDLLDKAFPTLCDWTAGGSDSDTDDEDDGQDERGATKEMSSK
jgi:hypothetical protein